MHLSSNQLEIGQTDSSAAAPDHHDQCQDHHRHKYQIHTDRAQPGKHLQNEERFYQEEIQWKVHFVKELINVKPNVLSILDDNN